MQKTNLGDGRPLVLQDESQTDSRSRIDADGSDAGSESGSEKSLPGPADRQETDDKVRFLLQKAADDKKSRTPDKPPNNMPGCEWWQIFVW